MPAARATHAEALRYRTAPCVELSASIAAARVVSVGLPPPSNDASREAVPVSPAPAHVVTAESTPLVSLAMPVAVARFSSLPVVPSNSATSDATDDDGPTTSPALARGSLPPGKWVAACAKGMALVLPMRQLRFSIGGSCRSSRVTAKSPSSAVSMASTCATFPLRASREQVAVTTLPSSSQP